MKAPSFLDRGRDDGERTTMLPRLPRSAPRRAQTGRAAAARGPARGARGGKPEGRASRVPFAVLVTGLVAGGMAALLGLNTLSAANELNRHGIASKDASIAAQVQQLRIDVAASSAPGYLARAAEALGMVPAGSPAFLVIGPDGKVRVMGSAGPATAPPLPVQPKPKPKTTSTSAKKATSTTKTTSKKSGKAAKGTKTKSSSAPKSASSPKPTPTSTVTLPGGTR